MQGSENNAKVASFSWVKLGFVVTIAYFVAVWLILHLGGIPGLFTISDGPLTLNTFGDFLAGFTAPLAFLWLFIATMVQSQELVLQRNELHLTRLEFEQSREVAIQQANEARHQAEFIGVQTKMMQEDQHDRHLQTLLDGFIAYVQQLPTSLSLTDDEGNTMKILTPANGPIENLKTLVYRFNRLHADLRDALRANPRRKIGGPAIVWWGLEDYLVQIEALTPKISDVQKAKLSVANFGFLRQSVDYLLTTTTEGRLAASGA